MERNMTLEQQVDRLERRTETMAKTISLHGETLRLNTSSINVLTESDRKDTKAMKTMLEIINLVDERVDRARETIAYLKQAVTEVAEIQKKLAWLTDDVSKET